LLSAPPRPTSRRSGATASASLATRSAALPWPSSLLSRRRSYRLQPTSTGGHPVFPVGFFGVQINFSTITHTRLFITAVSRLWLDDNASRLFPRLSILAGSLSAMWETLPPILSLIDVINNTIRLLPYAADKHIYFNDSAKVYLLGLISTMMERVWAWWISRSRLFLRNIFSQSIFYDSRLRFGHSTALILLIIPIMRVCSGLSPAQQIAYEILM